MTTSETTRTFGEAWASWQTARLRAATAPYGLASLVATNWLSRSPQPLEGLPGTWRLDGGVIVGEGLSGVDDVRLAEGGELELGRLLLRHHRRDDDVALRVLDPDAPSRAAVAGIDAFPPDPAWVLTGRFEPAADGSSVDIHEIDGYVESYALAGTVHLRIGGEEVALLATGARSGMQVVFSDTTSGGETYRFRFLRLRADVSNGHDGGDSGAPQPIEVDFNRAYLPPCAFADFYLCPMPAPQNRLRVAVRAGEKTVDRPPKERAR
ncbi:DUF1684 domain-containing protein [Herbiconiux sp. CPCC 203406]|uniref:DUF1684 domain-containing protein n=1 Tax=Herbiconiux oxytropis TaxID=2970915 RepID=UPI00217E4A3D|nr:DUF1684 domain-containing protein [Herbiconiux oxytropis]MCS5721413.1 DUF1684 domain-containing protein [Herbiconiux oxytropis]